MLSFKHYIPIRPEFFKEYELETKELITVDRNLEWTSSHGIKTKIVDMDDTYLANLFDYFCRIRESKYTFEVIKKFNESGDESCLNFDSKLMLVIRELQKERGLKDEFMDRAQIPYKNPDGKWEIWDFDKGYPIALEEIQESEEREA